MLGIGGQQAAALRLTREHHRSSGDQGFLLGQAGLFAGADRGQGGQSGQRTHDPGHHPAPRCFQADAAHRRGPAAGEQLRTAGGPSGGLPGHQKPGWSSGSKLGMRQGHHLGGLAGDLC